MTRTITITKTVAITTPASAGSSGGASQTKPDAALYLNRAYHAWQTALRKLPNLNSSSSAKQTAQGFAAQERLRAKFDAAISNLTFPASDRADVKRLLTTDTTLEDALANYSDDLSSSSAAILNSGLLNSDGAALRAARGRFEQALTALRYDVGDKA